MEKGREAPAAGSAAVSWGCIHGPRHCCREMPAGSCWGSTRCVSACCCWQGFMQCKSYISAGPAWQGGEPPSMHRATEPYGKKKNWISIVLSAPATTWKATLAFPPLLSEGFAGSKTILKLFMGQGVTNLQLAARKTQKKAQKFQRELEIWLLHRRHACYTVLCTQDTSQQRQRSGEDSLVCFMELDIPWFFFLS